METYDILVLVIVLVSLAVGARKGFVWQAATIVSLIGSAIVAMRFAGVLSPFFDIAEPWNHAAAALILFLVTSLIINLLFGFVESVIIEWKLKNFDRTAGAILGLIKGLLWATLLTFFIVMLGGPKGADFVLKSTSGVKLIAIIQEVEVVLPDKLKEALEGHINQFEQNLREPEGESVDLEAVWQQIITSRNLADLLPSTKSIGGDRIPIPPIDPIETDVPNSSMNDPKIEIGAGGATNSEFVEIDVSRAPSEAQIDEEIDRVKLRHKLMGRALQLTIASARLSLPRGRSLKNKTGKAELLEASIAENPKTQTLLKKGLQSPLTEHKIHYRTLGIGDDLTKDFDRTSSPATKLYQKLLAGEIEMPARNTTDNESETVAKNTPVESDSPDENQIDENITSTNEETDIASNDDTTKISNDQKVTAEQSTESEIINNDEQSIDNNLETDQPTAEESPSDNPPVIDKDSATDEETTPVDETDTDQEDTDNSIEIDVASPNDADITEPVKEGSATSPDEQNSSYDEETDKPIDEPAEESTKETNPSHPEETILVATVHH